MTHLLYIDPLLFRPGDRLTLADFLERWERMPELKFAELIDGVVYMPSPVSREHGRLASRMNLLLGVYAARTGRCETTIDATWLMEGSAPQPDVALQLLPQFGGKAGLAGNLAAGVPELVVEVSHSSRSYDLGPKLALYQRAGVNEYIAVLLEERRIEWRRLEGGSFRMIDAEGGILKSTVFPGLWLNEAAFWADDANRMLETLEVGLHAER